MNQPLANEALYRASAGLGERKPSYCQRWVRQCLTAVYGNRYGAWMKGSALRTARAFCAKHPAGSQVIKSSRVEDTQLGDLLYATEGHGGFGHVMIRVEGNRVAENSVVHHGPHGAIGFRSLWEVDFDIIVRLP
jgi:hypothetical protein